MISQQGWNTFKQQNERADTVEKTAAKRIQQVFTKFSDAFLVTDFNNVGCFMVYSEAYIHGVKHFMHREPIAGQNNLEKENYLFCLSF